jgi:hypothetical protein
MTEQLALQLEPIFKVWARNSKGQIEGYHIEAPTWEYVRAIAEEDLVDCDTIIVSTSPEEKQ